eukprot:CAMPEP_0195104212 /NCGR_PEP_ID=MMETSP0448-20130528/72967_1 /TAXON_ID=66468 /ORGANISM="Heterocapsa triquestra, Strain CCMP 448" /LENGTH=64 /DNA_ID=CAMNT_0040140011 /DNA_START=159 /DNA_END=349 /DNA_ORIENTATION=+
MLEPEKLAVLDAVCISRGDGNLKAPKVANDSAPNTFNRRWSLWQVPVSGRQEDTMQFVGVRQRG